MISYNALNVDGLKEVLQTIASACNKLDIDFFLVGAVARNIWYAKGDKDAGGTRDIDFGVYVPDQETYKQLKAYLIDENKYTQARDNVFGLDTPDGKRIDLLPFGEIDDISRICQHYPDIETNVIWEDHNELYSDELEHDEVAMIVLGRQMKEIMKDNQALSERIVGIIDKALNEESDVVDRMINDRIKETWEAKASIFKYIRRGIVEQKSN